MLRDAHLKNEAKLFGDCWGQQVKLSDRFHLDSSRDFVSFVQFYKNVTNTHGGALILVKTQDEACNFTLY